MEEVNLRSVCVGDVTHSCLGSDGCCLCRITIFVKMKWNAGDGVDFYSRARPRSSWGSVHSLPVPPQRLFEGRFFNFPSSAFDVGGRQCCAALVHCGEACIIFAPPLCLFGRILPLPSYGD